MNYLIFDNDIYYDSEGKIGILSKDKISSFFGQAQEFSVAVIDTLQKQVAAPEKPASKREEVLASSFSGEYLTQSERIAPNLFQVVAVEKPKVAEVYKHLGLENVKLLVSYGTALREFLKSKGLFSQNKRIIFLDHQGNQVLLTIFNNDVFTTPRRLSVAVKRVVSELTRSEENYKALNKEKEEISFLVATNSKEIVEEIASSGIEAKENILCFPEAYPALSGLKQGKFSMHYMLPEHFIRLRRLKIFKRRFFAFGIMASVLGMLFLMLLGSFSIHKNALMSFESLQLKIASGNQELKAAYAAKYKDILREKRKINFAYFFSVFFEVLPLEYKIESVSIRNLSSGHYRFEAIVYQEAKNKPLAEFSFAPTFKQARLENILVKGNPGVRITADIF
jgi:hypothetical protein